MKNTVNEIKNTLEGINCKLEEEEQINELEDRVVENNWSEQMKEKIIQKLK